MLKYSKNTIQYALSFKKIILQEFKKNEKKFIQR